jgi:hypothetical protein
METAVAQLRQLELRRPSVAPRINGPRYGPSRIAPAGMRDGSTKKPSDWAFRVERVTRIELA